MTRISILIVSTFAIGLSLVAQESESFDIVPQVEGKFVVIANEQEATIVGVGTAEKLKPFVLIDGPIHESFADVERHQTGPKVLVTSTPPKSLNETKAKRERRIEDPSLPIKQEAKPKSDQKQKVREQWIGGYWFWELANKRFVWVSGVWRVPPPGQKWTDGYWVRNETGSRWVAGHWKSKTASSDQYLPKPPENLDRGPRTPALSDLHFYCPGNWEYLESKSPELESVRDGEYVWRAGRWHPHEANWLWIPATYVWTPKGHVYSNGYWDYKFEDRGTAYLSVWFDFVNDQLDQERVELDRTRDRLLRELRFRPTQPLESDDFRRLQQAAKIQLTSQQIRREEQRLQTERNRKEFARQQERQRRREEPNQNLTQEQRRQSQLGRQQRMEVDRARDQRREAAQAPVRPSTEQLRLQNQREQRQRNLEQFMRSQERIKRRAEQSGSGSGK